MAGMVPLEASFFLLLFISLKPPFVYFNQAVTSEAALLVSRGGHYLHSCQENS
jgi:hypothetical protein